MKKYQRTMKDTMPTAQSKRAKAPCARADPSALAHLLFCQRTYDNDFEYMKYGISLSFIYFDNFDNNLQIHTKKIVYNGEEWQNSNKQSILETIKTIYSQNGLTYNPKYELNDYDEFTYEEYNFENIGLTLYFEENRFDGAVITKPETNTKL